MKASSTDRHGVGVQQHHHLWQQSGLLTCKRGWLTKSLEGLSILSTIHCSMMLNTLSPATVNKGDEWCLNEVGSCGENIPGSSIANL